MRIGHYDADTETQSNNPAHVALLEPWTDGIRKYFDRYTNAVQPSLALRASFRGYL